MICFHEIVYIDHHGKSCGLCGIALEGYGVASPFPGKQEGNERCLYGRTTWRIINKTEEQCVYCLLIRKRYEQPKKTDSWQSFKMLPLYVHSLYISSQNL
jgi:hypothetical protein